MSTTDVNDFLLGGGVPSAKFPEVGTVVKGTVVKAETSQQTDFTTGEPKTYSDGNPMLQVVVTLQTDERDPEVDNDDGLRKVYVKGQMRKAVGDAVRASGSKLEPGGILAVQFVSEEEPEKRGLNPKKVYRAQYQPAQAAQVDEALTGPDAQPAQAPAPAQPAASSLI
jgi:hypothetical protein